MNTESKNKQEETIEAIKDLIIAYGFLDIKKDAVILPVYVLEKEPFSIEREDMTAPVIVIFLKRKSTPRKIWCLTSSGEYLLNPQNDNVEKLSMLVKEITENEVSYRKAKNNYLDFLPNPKRTPDKIVSSFFYYMWNRWSKEECETIFEKNSDHIWAKWCDAGNKIGSASGAAEILYRELSDSNRKKLVNRAIFLYDGNKEKF